MGSNGDLLWTVLGIGVVGGAAFLLSQWGILKIPWPKELSWEGISKSLGIDGGGNKDEDSSIIQSLTKEQDDDSDEEGFGIVRDWIKEGFKLGDKEIKELGESFKIKKPMAPTKHLGNTSTDITRPYKKKANVNMSAPESLLDMIWPTIDRILPDLTIFAADEKKKRRAVVNRDAPESELLWGPQFGPSRPEINIKKPDFSRLTSGTRID